MFLGLPGIEFVQNNRVRTLTALELNAGRDVESRLEDVHGQADELLIQYQEAHGLALTLRIRLYPARPFALLRLCVANVGTTPVRLRRFFVRTPPGGLTTTGTPDAFYANGWQSWSPAGVRHVGTRPFQPSPVARWLRGAMIHNARTPWESRPDRFWSETVGAVVSSREALVAGIASVGDQFGQVWADLRPPHLQVMVQTQLDDVPLAVGESRASEWFYLEWVPLPLRDPFAQYAYAVARQMHVSPARRTPTGWCSWHVYGRDVGETDVMDNLASAALLADELPLGVIQLDNGYQDSWGDWSTRSERFPNSLDWLAGRIEGSRFKPGLWLAPFVVNKRSRLARDHPDWLLRGAHGRAIRAGLIADFVGRALDPTHPAVADYLRELVSTVVNTWGYKYLKLGFLYAAALDGQRYDVQMTRAQALRHALQTIREAAGPDAYIVGSGVPLGPVVGVLDAARVGPNTATKWAPSAPGPDLLVKGNPTLPSLRNSVRNAAGRAWMHARWWVNDVGALTVRDSHTELTGDEVLSQVTMAGLSGGLIMLSDKLDDIPPERRAMVAALFPPMLDGMDVTDLMDHTMPDTCVVPVARPWGRWRLVALFNWSDAPVERELPESVPINERKAYHIVDFWERRYLWMEPGAFRPVLQIPSHGVVLLGVRSAKPQPQLVATTFHISQGGEVTDWESGPDSLQVTLEIGRLARGAVWLSLPRRPSEVTLDGQALPESAVHAVASGVWSVSCQLVCVGTLRIRWSTTSSE